MTQVFFHCSNEDKVVWDRCGASISDLPELHDYAIRAIRKLLAAPSLEDWRNWILHVSDEAGRELFEMPFASVLGKLH